MRLWIWLTRVMLSLRTETLLGSSKYGLGSVTSIERTKWVFVSHTPIKCRRHGELHVIMVTHKAKFYEIHFDSAGACYGHCVRNCDPAVRCARLLDSESERGGRCPNLPTAHPPLLMFDVYHTVSSFRKMIPYSLTVTYCFDSLLSSLDEMFALFACRFSDGGLFCWNTGLNLFLNW